MAYWVTVSWDFPPKSRPEVNIVAGPYATLAEAAGVAQQLLRQVRAEENASSAFQQLKEQFGEAGARERIRFDAESEAHLQEKVRQSARFGYNKFAPFTHGVFPLE